MSTRSSRRFFSRPPPPPPPALSDSDPMSALSNNHGANSSLFETCKALQSILTTQSARSAAAATSSPARPTRLQPAPPLPSPVPLALRPVAPAHTPSKIHKCAPRTAKKRSKPATPDDDTTAHDHDAANNGRDPFRDGGVAGGDGGADAHVDLENRYYLRFSTPKRQRLAPLTLPLGLERADYDALKPLSESEQNPRRGGASNDNPDEWSTEEDRVLVELVLEKMKLTKGDWVDCAKTLGKDRGSVGKRWKSLVGDGSVGLRRSGRRTAAGSRRPTVEGLFDGAR